MFLQVPRGSEAGVVEALRQLGACAQILRYRSGTSVTSSAVATDGIGGSSSLHSSNLSTAPASAAPEATFGRAAVLGFTGGRGFMGRVRSAIDPDGRFYYPF